MIEKNLFQTRQKKIWKTDTYNVIRLPLHHCNKTRRLPERLEIHLATKAHIPFLLDNWPEPFTYLGSTVSELEKVIQNRMQNGDTCVLATIDSKYAASSWVSNMDMHLLAYNIGYRSGVFCWKNIFVRPCYRGSGLAVELYNKTVEVLKQNSGMQLYSFVQPGNSKSLNLMNKTLNASFLGKLVFLYFLVFKIVHFVDKNGNKKRTRHPKPGEFVF